MKKWWFSILMFIFDFVILIYGIVMICLGEIELFYQGGVVANYSILAIIVLIIGLANTSKKESKDESDND